VRRNVRADTHVYYEIDRAKDAVMIFMLRGARDGGGPKI
jgi:hypothetical protein